MSTYQVVMWVLPAIIFAAVLLYGGYEVYVQRRKFSNGDRFSGGNGLTGDGDGD